MNSSPVIKNPFFVVPISTSIVAVNGTGTFRINMTNDSDMWVTDIQVSAYALNRRFIADDPTRDDLAVFFKMNGQGVEWFRESTLVDLFALPKLALGRNWRPFIIPKMAEITGSVKHTQLSGAAYTVPIQIQIILFGSQIQPQPGT